MISAACDALGVSYLSSVTLYQSLFFAKEFPEENSRFGNLVLVDGESDLQGSLLSLRKRMFSDFDYESAVFIGGMAGVLDEHGIFSGMHPKATILAVPRPGGAAADLARGAGYDPATDPSPTNFTQLFIHKLGVSPAEARS
jgi:hypothetical protein